MKFRRVRIGRRRRARTLRVERLPGRRVLAAITGTIFDDTNASMDRDESEAGLIGRLVFLDQNANAIPDVGEAFALTDADGRFRFENLSGGDFRVALFNGTQTQVQTSPVASQWVDTVTGFQGGRQIIGGPSRLVLADGVLVVPDGAGSRMIELPADVTSAIELPGGLALVVRAGVGGDDATTSLVVDLNSGEVTPVDLEAGQTADGYTSVAIGAGGRGVAIEASDDSLVKVRAIDVSTSVFQPDVQLTSTQVPAGTAAFVSDTGVRTLLASPQANGTIVQLWSNQSATPVTPIGQTLEHTTTVAAFHDDAGLLAMRTDDGGLRLFDVDANFAPLFGIPAIDGPVLLDPAHDRLFTLASETASLRVFDLGDGRLITEMAMDLSGLGPIVDLASGRLDDSLRILGAAGLIESRINTPTAIEVSLSNDQSIDGLLFGVSIDGPNDPPQFGDVPRFELLEDTSLVEITPILTLGTLAADNDAYVVVPITAAQHGSAQITPGGRLTYVPEADFFGRDSLWVALHDGQGMSDPVEIVLDVLPVPDAPQGIGIDIDVIPENVLPGVPLGNVNVLDADGFDHDLEISDPRFDVRDGQLVLVGGTLDHESEPTVTLTITATDRETSDRVSVTREIGVGDEDDPVTQILPNEASVDENVAGASVANLTVVDQDSNQVHVLSVDDDRFVIEGTLLRLKDGISLDFETTPTVVVGVTATPQGGSGGFTGAITIRVNDRMEQPTRIDLTDRTLMEWVHGDSAGNLLIDNTSPSSRFDFSVSDTRFTIVNGLLKLLDNIFVDHDQEPVIPVTVTATDRDGEFNPISGTFQIRVQPNNYRGHNYHNPFDVDDEGTVTPRDVHHIINYLNQHGPGPVGPESLPEMMDVNADGLITAVDALLVVNRINQNRHGGPQVGGEAEDDDRDTEDPLIATPDQPDGEGEKIDEDDDSETVNASASDQFVREFEPGETFGPFPIDDSDDDDDLS
ncbi:MAG: dockerin type I domain-containing protein [Planctomycetota bacterium]